MSGVRDWSARQWTACRMLLALETREEGYALGRLVHRF